MDCLNIFIVLLSTLIGGVITWLVSRFYYISASNDLGKEANQLRELTKLMLRGMESAGLVEYNRDDKGSPIGIVFKLSIEEKMHLTDKVEATVIPDSSMKNDT